MATKKSQAKRTTAVIRGDATLPRGGRPDVVDATVTQPNPDPIVEATLDTVTLTFRDPEDVPVIRARFSYWRQSGASGGMSPEIIIIDTPAKPTEVSDFLEMIANLGAPAAGSSYTKKYRREATKWIINKGYAPLPMTPRP